MSDFMATCPWCSERFTHAKDYLSHLPLHRGPAVESPRVPAYRPILPPVPPQSLEVSVSDPLIPSPTGTPILDPKKVPPLLAGGILTLVGEELAKGGDWDLGRGLSLSIRVLLFVLPMISAGWRK